MNKYMWWINSVDLSRQVFKSEAEARVDAEAYCDTHLLDKKTIKIELI